MHEHDLPTWKALGLQIHGRVIAGQGELERGVSNMEEGIALLTAIGHRLGLSANCAYLAEARMRAGALAEARQMLERCKALVAETAERFYEPENPPARRRAGSRRGGRRACSARGGSRASRASPPRSHRVRQPPGSTHGRALCRDGARSPPRTRRERQAGARPACRPAGLIHREFQHRRSRRRATASRALRGLVGLQADGFGAARGAVELIRVRHRDSFDDARAVLHIRR